MATSSFDSAFRIGCTTFALPVGLTNNARYFGAEAYLQSTVIEYVGAGGTLVVLGCNYGATLAAATLAAVGYFQIDPTTPLIIPGPACFYVGALGATAVCSVQRNYSQGASFFP